MNPPYEQADRYLCEVLSTLGLDAGYTRAEGNTLHRALGNGEEVPVIDFISGFGTLILGHNHPRLVARAQELLAARTPVYVQFTRCDAADRVVDLLNTIARREFPESEDGYAAVFGNSGAEAIEIALKHAELERVFKIAALGEQLAGNLATAREAVGAGAPVAAAVRALVPGSRTDQDGSGEDDATVLAAAATAVAEANAAALARPPVFVSLEGGFHGKLVGSLGATHNPQVRLPFAALVPQAEFIPADTPQALRDLFSDERAVVLDLVYDGKTVDVVERPVPLFAGLLVEPVQGEGGIRPLSSASAAELTEICATVDCPVIVDDIQSGTGRTGTFFAGAQIGLRGDYVAMSKSLGGGVAKVSVTLVRSARYRREFEALHSSTFAKDGFSSPIALRVLELLEADDGLAYRKAAERGARIRSVLDGIKTDFGDVVSEVRGRGLLLGFEFRDQSGAASTLIADKARSGMLGLFIAGFLLNEHRIRLMPTGGSPNTLRIQPSIFITDDEIGRLETGLREVCAILRAQDALHLVHAIAAPGTPKPRTEFRSFAASRTTAQDTAPAACRAAHLQMVGSPEQFRRLDPSLADLADAELLSYMARLAPARVMTAQPPTRFTTTDGTAVDITIIPIVILPLAFEDDPAGVVTDAATALHGARTAGHSVVGLDRELASFLGAAGLTAFPGVALTSGDAEITADYAANATAKATVDKTVSPSGC